jgi:steroid delta-isomerase-like uncharacterized protein
MVYISSPFAGIYGESFILFIRSTYLRMGTEQQILREKREYIVKQHVDAENRHDVVASIATFHTPRYQVFPMGIVHDGANAVGELLSGIFKGFPDFTVEIVKMHHSDNAVILEIKMKGTHRDDWAGLKAKGRKMDVPVACIFEFDGEHLMCEKVYFDMATLMNQLSA